MLGLFAAIAINSTANAALVSNLATSGSATQSSTAWGGVAERAIDGNTSGVWGNNSVTHTLESELSAWWQVNLLDLYEINEMNIWNRVAVPSIMIRLTDFNVSILDENIQTVWSEDYFVEGGYPSPNFIINLPDNTIGQYVRVQLNNPGPLSLAEVQVFGTSVPVPVPATILLFGSGLTFLLGLSRRKG